jgi:dynein heavy chain 2
VRKVQIETELAEIEPILESAKSAVNGIKKGDLSEIRAFRMPPPAINHVLAGVLTLLKEDDLSWENMRKFLNKPSCKHDIINFDAGSVSSETRKKTMALVQKNSNSFEQAVIERASIAGAPLAAWVKAIVKYNPNTPVIPV